MIHRLAESFGQHPAVLAVALSGSRGAGSNDGESDFDLYVYAVSELPLDFRRAIAASPDAEIDNRYWEPGDEWVDQASGARVDVMYRSPAWIEDQLDRVLVRHEPSIGYSTCFWYNILRSEPLFDPRGWYAGLQARARVPYPGQLKRSIIGKNYPLLRRNQSSYRRQIELALQRHDGVSVQHRMTALLASYFDIWFALERLPHPGEKRLLNALLPDERQMMRAVLEAPPESLLESIDVLLDQLDRRLEEPARPGAIEHVAAWVTDLERAKAFYERWFGAVTGPAYHSRTRDFRSYFLRLGTVRLELMRAPGERARQAHIAISVGSTAAVEALVRSMKAEGVTIVSGPRLTGDGYYEAVVADSEGNLLEITV
jgi:catechol 2,3-dioxygenase-like lactoylglutathione lyase family enzyme